MAHRAEQDAAKRPRDEGLVVDSSFIWAHGACDHFLSACWCLLLTYLTLGFAQVLLHHCKKGLCVQNSLIWSCWWKWELLLCLPYCHIIAGYGKAETGA